MSKPVNNTSRPPMGSYISVKRPWQKLFIDFLGPYPRSRQGNKYLLVVLDQYSRFALLEPMRDASTKNVINYLENRVFHVFSVPESILSDNAKQFCSTNFKNFLTKFGVKQVLTPKYSPQSNLSERVNRSVLTSIRSYIRSDHANWDEHIHSIGAALRNVIHQSTKWSPHFLVFGNHYMGHGSDYSLLHILKLLNDSEVELTNSDRLSLVQNNVLDNLRKAYNQSSHYYNLRSRARKFRVGQEVFARNFIHSSAPNKFAAKLAPKYIKAYIHKPIGNVAYQLCDVDGKSLGVYHMKDLK